MGLAEFGLARVVTTGLAFITVCRLDCLKPREWMIRSYVVTFGFVFFRIFVVASSILQVGEIQERLTVASRICWSLPLLVSELVIQGRKIFRPLSFFASEGSLSHRVI